MTSAGYSYLFKYIVIGDTGKALSGEEWGFFFLSISSARPFGRLGVRFGLLGILPLGGVQLVSCAGLDHS